jgi:predicted transcriptional regulator
MADSSSNVELAAKIMSAYVSNNSVRVSDLAGLFGEIHSALVHVSNGAAIVTEPEAQMPAVPIKKSLASDHLICLEDGKRFKSLKRHLRTQHDLTPEEYRQKWHLASTYPMVAPAYAKARSALAKKSGLGQARRNRK